MRPGLPTSTTHLHVVSLGIVTATSVVAALTLPVTARLMFLMIVLIWGKVMVGPGRYIQIVIIAALSLITPLFVIHGLLNPAYRPGTYFGVLFFRFSTAGINHAIDIGSTVTTLFAAGFLWQFIPADRFMNEALACHLPLTVTLMLFHAMAVARETIRRTERVFIAQQARGFPVSANVLSRVRAIPSIVIPVVASVLTDAVVRSQMLYSRGLGSTQIKTTMDWTEMSTGEFVSASIVLSAYLLLLAISYGQHILS